MDSRGFDVIGQALNELNITDDNLRDALRKDLKEILGEEVIQEMTVETLLLILKSVLIKKENSIDVSDLFIKDLEVFLQRKASQLKEKIQHATSEEDKEIAKKQTLDSIKSFLKERLVEGIDLSMFRPTTKMIVGLDLLTGIGIKRIINETRKRYLETLKVFDGRHIAYAYMYENEAKHYLQDAEEVEIKQVKEEDPSLKKYHPILSPLELFLKITRNHAFIGTTLESMIIDSAENINASDFINNMTEDIASIKKELNIPGLKLRSEISILNDTSSFFVPLLLPLMVSDIDPKLINIYKIIPQSFATMDAEMIRPLYLWLKLLAGVELFTSNYLINLFFVDSIEDPNSILPSVYLNFIDQTAEHRTVRRGRTYFRTQIALTGGNVERNVIIGVAMASPFSVSDVSEGNIANITGNAVFNLLQRIDDGIMQITDKATKAVEVILAIPSTIRWEGEVQRITNRVNLRMNDFFVRGRNIKTPRLYITFEELPDSFEMFYVILRLIVEPKILISSIHKQYLGSMSFSDFELLIPAVNRILEPYQSQSRIREYFEKLRSVLDTIKSEFKG